MGPKSLSTQFWCACKIIWLVFFNVHVLMPNKIIYENVDYYNNNNDVMVIICKKLGVNIFVNVVHSIIYQLGG